MSLRVHDEMVADWMKDPKFKAEYDALVTGSFSFYALIAG
jgi:hypothetical protein